MIYLLFCRAKYSGIFNAISSSCIVLCSNVSQFSFYWFSRGFHPSYDRLMVTNLAAVLTCSNIFTWDHWWGFQTAQAYSRIGRIKAIQSSSFPFSGHWYKFYRMTPRDQFAFADMFWVRSFHFKDLSSWMMLLSSAQGDVQLFYICILLVFWCW